jgi:hypothetical protein
MDLFIHYTSLPEGKELADVVGELNEVLDDHGVVCGGEDNRLDLDLEEENINPKYAQIAVKAYLQRAGFARDTKVEIGGMEIGVYE